VALIENGVLLQVNPMEIGVDGKFEIPNSVTIIGDSAFDDCTTLTDITIPSSVISIGNCAFANCNNIEEIFIDSNNEYDFERTKGLLPANLQSKVVSFEKMQEKKKYRNSQFNDVLFDERLMPSKLSP
jgi:hypothetical protein